MAMKVLRGDAVPVSRKLKVVPALPGVGDIFKLGVNGKFATFTALTDQVADVVNGLVTAWNASTVPEHKEWSAAAIDDDSDGFVDYLVFTTKVAGQWCDLEAATENATDGLLTITEITKGVAAGSVVEKITLHGTGLGGTWTYSNDFGGGAETSDPIAAGASQSAVKSALVSGMASVGTGDITVTGPAGGPYLFFWGGTLAGTDFAAGTVDGSSLTGTGEAVIETVTEGEGDTNELQRFGHTATAGNGTLLFDGFPGIANGQGFSVPWNATAASLQPQVDEVLGAGNATIWGGHNAAAGASGGAWIIAFHGVFNGFNLPLVTWQQSTLNGIVSGPTQLSAGGASTGNSWQYVSFGQATGGTAKLSYSGTPTGNIAATASAATVQAALDTIPVLAGNTSVTSFFDGYLVEFVNALADSNVSTLTIESSLTGTATTPAVYSVLDGVPDGVEEVKRITIYANGGTFTIGDGTDTTAALAWNLSAATLKTRLEADLAAITTVSIAGTGPVTDPFVVTCTSASPANVADWTANNASLTGGGGQVQKLQSGTAGTNEVQRITLNGVIGGTYTITNPATSAESTSIAYNANAATVDTAIEVAYGAGNVTVTGTGPWDVEFTGALATTDVPMMVGDPSGLNGGAGTQTLTITELVASAGPSHWDDPSNWSDGTLPVNGDDVVVESPVPILYGLEEVAATFNSIKFLARQSRPVGLPRRTASGYFEYRPRRLVIGLQGDAVVEIGAGEGSGTGRMELDFGADEAHVTVFASGGSLESGVPAITLVGSNVANTLKVVDGDVGTAVFPGETFAVDTIEQYGGQLALGAGTTVATSIDKLGGELLADEATLNGKLIIRG